MISKVTFLLTLLMTAVAVAQEAPVPPVPGTDLPPPPAFPVPNANNWPGFPPMPGAPGYTNPAQPVGPTTLYAWCMQTPGRIERILSGADLPYYIASSGKAHSAKAPTLWRYYLVYEINNLLRTYPGGVAFNPLTHSVLMLALELNKQFPAGDLADQSASIVLHHMLQAAYRVNVNFDQQSYLPLFGQCGPHGCQVPTGPNMSQFYLDYVSTAREVVAQLFAPAVSQFQTGGSVLDAMAVDRWELGSALVSIEWTTANLSASIFRRDTICLQQHLTMLARNLRWYLGQHAGKTDYEDMMMRNYVRTHLNYALDELNYYAQNSGHCLAPRAGH